MADASSRSDREVWLATIERGLTQAPGNPALLFERAKTLDALGRVREALDAYAAVLDIEPRHFGALNDLGLMEYRNGSVSRALDYFRAAVAAAPDNAVGHANVAHMLLRAGEHAGARDAYENALRLAPKMAEAHRGLSLALRALGDPTDALAHERAGYAQAPLTALPFRGVRPAPTILLLVSNAREEQPLAGLIDQRTFAVTQLVVEMSDYLDGLPEHDLVVNAVADPDDARDMIDAAEELCLHSGKPVVNAPRRIAQGGRIENAARFGLLSGIRAAKLYAFGREALVAGDVAARLSELDLAPPFLIRGKGARDRAYFMKVARPEDVPGLVRDASAAAFYAMQYFDLRRPDGTYRKYRMINVDGTLYPLHAATAHDWNVSRRGAEMAENAAFRAYERAFLQDPAAVIGAVAMRRLADIAACLDLDYSGIDFGIDAEGRVVVFDASAAMDVPPPDDDEKWAYRWFAVQRVREAVTRMLLERLTP